MTVAIRSILAVSGTLMALMGSAPVLAGSCVRSAPATLSCNGTFLGTAPQGPFTPVVDMTLVLGDLAPTSVTPAAGQFGVDASWGGHVGVTSFADITTAGADGVHLSGASTATVDNQGSIHTEATAEGVNALDIQADGDISIVNGGEILAYGSGAYDVTAVTAYSAGGGLAIDNLATGSITASAQDGNAIGILGFASGTGLVTNAGQITATSVDGLAIGVLEQADGDAVLVNSGSITADSTFHQGIAVLASSGSGLADVVNTGQVSASGGDDQSFGIQSSGFLGASIANGGTITVHSTEGTAFGALASTENGDAGIVNDSAGSIFGYTSGFERLVGMQAGSANGTASVDNAGFIQLIGRVNDNTTVGMAAYSAEGSIVGNTGYVLAGSYSGATLAALAVAQSGDASIHNGDTGYIRSIGASYNDGASSTGVFAQSMEGDATVNNEGRIVASSTRGNGNGIVVRAAGGDAFADNSGYVRGAGLVYGNAIGISAVSDDGLAAIRNTGTAVADNLLILGRPLEDQNDIRGLEAVGYAGTTVDNFGLVRASGAWRVRGVVAVANYGDVQVTNAASGRIVVKGLSAYGVLAEAQYGDFTAAVDNAGDITVIQAGNCYCNGGAVPRGVGIKATSLYAGGADVLNSGSIDVISQHDSYGIWAVAYTGDTAAENTGRIDLFSSGYSSVNTGMSVISNSGSASVVNSGDIVIQMPERQGTPYFNVDASRGMSGETGAPHGTEYAGGPRPDGGGDVHVANSGRITVLGAQVAYGMEGTSHYQQAFVSNSGDITLLSDTARSAGTGMFGVADNFGYAHDPAYHNPDSGVVLDNSGRIHVDAIESARGMRAFATFRAGAEITNTGDIDVLAAGGAAYGMWASSFNNLVSGGSLESGLLLVDNSGHVAALNHAGSNDTDGRGGVNAFGILAGSFTNDIAVTNSGDIVAEATAGTCSEPGPYACFRGATVGSAIGIVASSGHGHYHGYYTGDVAVANTGTIVASVQSSSSTQTTRYAYSPDGAFAAGILAVADYGNVDAINTGVIQVDAKGEGFTPEGQSLAGWATTAAGIMGSTYGSLADDTGEIMLANTGAISVRAEATYADGTALASGIAAQHDTFYYGPYNAGQSNGRGDIAVSNDGAMSVEAIVTGAGTGAATANGISAVSVATFGNVGIVNHGRIQAVAEGPLAVHATGVLGGATTLDAWLGAGSVVVAQATGASGRATGLWLTGDALTASNHGLLQAEFIGAAGDAIGAHIASPTGAVTFDNSGSITAIDADSAVGVRLDSLTSTTLVNSGSIRAVSAPAGAIAVRTGASADRIANYGSISGALVTGDGDDVMDAFGRSTWNAMGLSDFGAGDDAIHNAGWLNLHDATLDMGSHGALGNTFDNIGRLTVGGDNEIHMGVGNTQAFVNSGIIDFQDSAPDDVLTVVGDFGGSGAINLDVSGLHGTSDLLYVVGDIVDGSVNTLNITMVDLPTSTSLMNIPMVYVDGASTPGSFVLGQVNYDANKSFLTLDFGLVAKVVGSSGLFSLGIHGTEPAPDPSLPALPSGSPFAVEGPLPVALGGSTPLAGTPVGGTPMAGTPAAGLPEAASPVPAARLLVSGLSDSGTLAAAIAPGVQSLMQAQVGSWRQRTGVAARSMRGSVGTSVRLFQNDGEIDPGHVAGNFGQGGNFGYSQRSSGTELGVDYAVSDQFIIGLSLAKSKSNQHLSAGSGASRLDGDTAGLHATWLSTGGAYVDASLRRMQFDARLDTPSAQVRTEGHADAFDVEAGYGWALANSVTLEPQAQFTRTRVDGVDRLQGELASFESRGGDSSRGRLGLAVRRTFEVGQAAWTPYLVVSAVREFDGENRFSINDDFRGRTSVEGSSAQVETGLDVRFGRLSLFGGANWQDGDTLDGVLGGQLGARYNW